MKRVTRLATAGFAVTTLLLAACSAPVRLGTHSDEIDPADVDFSRGSKIRASASGFQLLLLLPIGMSSRYERAYETLSDVASGYYITDVQINESWRYALIGTLYKTTIRATAYPMK
jgi:hypothetical protein